MKWRVLLGLGLLFLLMVAALGTWNWLDRGHETNWETDFWDWEPLHGEVYYSPSPPLTVLDEAPTEMVATEPEAQLPQLTLSQSQVNRILDEWNLMVLTSGAPEFQEVPVFRAQSQEEYGPHPECEDYPTFSPARPYQTHPEIADLAQWLYSLGYYNGPPTQTYTPALENAVRHFQRARGLTPDGIVGPKTWAALGTSGSMIVAKTNQVQPPPGERSILVDLTLNKLYLMVDGEIFKTYPIAIGKPSTPSPIGSWEVINKRIYGGAFGSRWLGLNVPWGTYGIHGTNRPWSIGRSESAGCIRMYNNHVEEIYEWIDIGVSVTIRGHDAGPTWAQRTLRRGSEGADVYAVQMRLGELGFYEGPFDGSYGTGTIKAVEEFQKARGLSQTGRVDHNVYNALGFYQFQ